LERKSTSAVLFAVLPPHRSRRLAGRALSHPGPARHRGLQPRWPRVRRGLTTNLFADPISLLQRLILRFRISCSRSPSTSCSTRHKLSRVLVADHLGDPIARRRGASRSLRFAPCRSAGRSRSRSVTGIGLKLPGPRLNRW